MSLSITWIIQRLSKAMKIVVNVMAALFFFFFFGLPASGMGLFLLCLISFFGYALSGASKVGVQLEGYSTERRIKQVNLQEPKIWCFLECT